MFLIVMINTASFSDLGVMNSPQDQGTWVQTLLRMMDFSGCNNPKYKPSKGVKSSRGLRFKVL